MKQFKLFFLLSGLFVFFGGLGNTFFVWGGGCCGKGGYERIGEDKPAKFQSGEKINPYEESFKKRDFFYERLRGYTTQAGEDWTLQKEDDPLKIDILYKGNTLFKFVFLDVGSSIRSTKSTFEKNTYPNVDFLTLIPKSSDKTIDDFLGKIEKDLKEIKTSSLPHKTVYFKSKPRQEKKIDLGAHEFLILDESRRALKIEFRPQNLPSK